MNNEKFHPWLHRLAVSTVCVALVTLTFGALVTTKRAGMAFADWPTSDGYLMVTYPWLQDFSRNWNKFLEHGHRLAGMLIGIWSIALVAVTTRLESRRWVKLLAAGILLGVICQGVLGGFRVQLNARGLAMLHGIFAAIVFSLMGIMAVVTSRNWRELRLQAPIHNLTVLRVSSAVLVVFASLQYLLGSLIRHQGTALREHYWLGLTVFVLAVVTGIIALFSRVSWLKRSGSLVILTVVVQVSLGLLAWGLKYGITALGYVAVADSSLQVWMRTSHMVWGVITLMTLVVHLVRVFRVANISPRLPDEVLEIRRTTTLMHQGGAS